MVGRREACGSQRVVWLLQLPAEPLDGRCGIVADAIDREEQVIGPADEAGQKCRAVLDAAVVVQEAGACAFDQPFLIRCKLIISLRFGTKENQKNLRAKNQRGGEIQMALFS
jgi:hypothetical protein